MSYLSKLIDFENRLREWEIKDEGITKYMEDSERKENWLKRGKYLEEDVLNSSLSYEDKSFILERINKSYQHFKSNNPGKEEDVIEKLTPYIIGFLGGVVFVYLIKEFISKLGEDFGRGLSKGLNNKDF